MRVFALEYASFVHARMLFLAAQRGMDVERVRSFADSALAEVHDELLRERAHTKGWN